MKKRPTIYHYSREGSKAFWLRVSRLECPADRERIYRMTCLLQNLEELVLEDLARCEEVKP
jgi:hypothetical protein